MSLRDGTLSIGDRVRKRLRAWLGVGTLDPVLYGLVDGLRRDFDALATVLQERDLKAASADTQIETLARQAEVVLPNHANALNDINLRLTHYERSIPLISRARKTLVAKVQAEQRRLAAEQALAQATPAAPAGEGAESEAEMERLETESLERELRLVREGEGESVSAEVS